MYTHTIIYNVSYVLYVYEYDLFHIIIIIYLFLFLHTICSCMIGYWTWMEKGVFSRPGIAQEMSPEHCRCEC